MKFQKTPDSSTISVTLMVCSVILAVCVYIYVDKKNDPFKEGLVQGACSYAIVHMREMGMIGEDPGAFNCTATITKIDGERYVTKVELTSTKE